MIPGMMACFWSAVCSASDVVDKQLTDATTCAAYVDGLEKTMDLSVFLDLLGKSVFPDGACLACC